MKERLLGAAVLIAAAVLLIPAFLDGPRSPDTVSRELALPVPDAGSANTGSEANRTHTVEIDTGDAASREDPTVIDDAPSPPPAIPPQRSQTSVAPAPSAATTAPTRPESESPTASDNQAQAGPVAKPVPSPTGWAVQVGSFTSETNARRLMEHLKDDAYPAFVVRNVVNGRVMFRVRVGPESDKLRAEALAERLKADRQKTQLVRHP